MTLYLKFIKIYINMLSHIVPKYAGKLSFRLFETTRKYPIKKREQPFYEKAMHFRVPFEDEDLYCYEMGNPQGKLIFLVHGWDSNAGSLSQFAFKLADKNYRVISFDLPAHANSKIKRTNLFICKNAFKTLLKYINPQEPFSIITHSFGSALSSYSLSEMNYKIDKYILLTANNALEPVFLDFKNAIGFNAIIYKQFSNLVTKTMGEKLENMHISKKIPQIDYKKILIIHDKFDKVLRFHNAEEIHKLIPNTTLSVYEKIGHYRMLWNDDVIQETVNFIDEDTL